MPAGVRAQEIMPIVGVADSSAHGSLIVFGMSCLRWAASYLGGVGAGSAPSDSTASACFAASASRVQIPCSNKVRSLASLNS